MHSQSVSDNSTIPFGSYLWGKGTFENPFRWPKPVEGGTNTSDGVRWSLTFVSACLHDLCALSGNKKPSACPIFTANSWKNLKCFTRAACFSCFQVQEYQQAKAEREAAYEAEQERLRVEKEREIARLRALQERAKDEQAERDALRAKRAQEAVSTLSQFSLYFRQKYLRANGHGSIWRQITAKARRFDLMYAQMSKPPDSAKSQLVVDV